MCRFKEIEFLLKENIFIADYFHFILRGRGGLIEISASAVCLQLNYQNKKYKNKLLPLNFDS